MSVIAPTDRALSPPQWIERNPLWQVGGPRPHAGSRFAKRAGTAREAGPPSEPLDRATGLPVNLSADRALCLRLRQLLGLSADAPLTSEATPWASATFSGMRHRLEIELWSITTLSQATRLERAIKESDFDLPGHIVADVTARVSGSVCLPGGDCRIVVEALTVAVEK
jgi:hypothetical protein